MQKHTDCQRAEVKLKLKLTTSSGLIAPHPPLVVKSLHQDLLRNSPLKKFSSSPTRPALTNPLLINKNKVVTMLRFVAGRIGSAVRGVVAVPRTSAAIGVTSTRNSSHGPEETDEEFDTRMENYFNRKDIDHWEIRTAMNDLAGKSSSLF